MKSNRYRQAHLPHQDNGNSAEKESHLFDWRTPIEQRVPKGQAAQPQEPSKANHVAANDAIGEELRLSLIPISEVIKRTAIGKTTIYQLVKSHDFPQPVKVCGATRWVAGEISDWIQSLMCKRWQGIQSAQ